MAQKFRGEILIPELKDGLSVVASEPGTGIVLDDKPVLPRRCRLTLSGAGITADSSLPVSGTVDIFYLDLGNEAS